jgi:hypothetical protein
MLKHLYKGFPYLEFILWFNFLYQKLFGGFLAELLPGLLLLLLYLVFPVFVFGSKGLKHNVWAQVTGVIFAAGFYATALKGYEFAPVLGQWAFWLALASVIIAIVQTFRAAQPGFYAQTSLRLAMVAMLCAPYTLGWWV